ncbi:hypothetical protein [Nocardia africana]
MKFRLKLWLLELDIETPAPEQVSTIDLVTAMMSTMQSQPIMLIPQDCEADDETD